MILGILTALGTTRLSALTLGIVLLYLCALVLFRKHRRISIPTPLWLLTGCIVLSAIWSVNPGKPLWICTHIITAYLAYQVLPHNSSLRHTSTSSVQDAQGRLGSWRDNAKWGISAVAAIQIGVVLWQYMYTDAIRPNGISRNASILGLSGLWMFPSILPAIMAGLSISRTSLGGAILFAICGKRYIIPALVLIVVSLVTTLLTNPDRLSLETISRNWDVRYDALHGKTSEATPLGIDPVDPVDVRWRWYGYGWGQYYLATGQIQPHNIFVRSWYELGLFTIPVGYCLVYMWVSMRPGRGVRGQDWRFMMVACATGMLTDELLGSVEGVYMVLGYVIMNTPHSSLRRGLMRETVAAPAVSTI